MLHLVVQIDDYVYAGTHTLSDEFEAFTQHESQVGLLESAQFDIMKAK